LRHSGRRTHKEGRGGSPVLDGDDDAMFSTFIADT